LKIERRTAVLCLIVLPFAWIAKLNLEARETPQIQMQNGAGQLIVDGQPFLILGGELGNSSAGTAAEADAIVPNVARLHVNTILMPVAWEQIEPTEGNFDFGILDHWIHVARQNHVHLVLLWFGSWKNAFSNYAPAWVKEDSKRFPRAQAADGAALEILSALSEENRRSDSRAFAALMRHVREIDAEPQTVLMVQVENEVGYLGWEQGSVGGGEWVVSRSGSGQVDHCARSQEAAFAGVGGALQPAGTHLERSIWRCCRRSVHGVELRELH
jgi:hypothetical protein